MTPIRSTPHGCRGERSLLVVRPRPSRDSPTSGFDHGGANLGIVGDPEHQQKGTRYHLGESQLAVGAYSVRLRRDRKGLSEAASALDLGKLEMRIGSCASSPTGSCQAKDGQTPDIREIIWSPDGKEVRRWDSSLGKVIVSLRRRQDKTIVTVTRQRRRDALQPYTRQLLQGLARRAEAQVSSSRSSWTAPGLGPEPDPDDDVDDGHPAMRMTSTRRPPKSFVEVQPSPVADAPSSGSRASSGRPSGRSSPSRRTREFRDDPGIVFAGQKAPRP